MGVERDEGWKVYGADARKRGRPHCRHLNVPYTTRELSDIVQVKSFPSGRAVGRVAKRVEQGLVIQEVGTDIEVDVSAIG